MLLESRASVTDEPMDSGGTGMVASTDTSHRPSGDTSSDEEVRDAYATTVDVRPEYGSTAIRSVKQLIGVAGHPNRVK